MTKRGQVDRQAILEAAAALLLERGHEGLSLRGVADRLGYSATTIYLYYADKDDLLRALCAEGFARFQRALEAVRNDDPIGLLADLGRAYVRFGRANPVHYRLMFMHRPDLLGGSDRSPSFEVLVGAVQAAVDAGALRPGDPRAYSLALWASVHGLTSLLITGMVRLPESEVEPVVDLVLRSSMRGLAAR